MKNDKTTFALFFGNRGLFPPSLLSEARKDMVGMLDKMGYNSIMPDEKSTRHGAVETVQEARIYADFLKKNKGNFGGVILSLPNFGDETGAVEALRDADVPILIQAYPDELNKMKPELRRDAFCGKFSVMDVFCQYGVPFTALKPHTIHPGSQGFQEQIIYFDSMCRVANGMKRMTVGAIGARTTPFKTVRTDELTLQKYGITVETFDLSSLFSRIDKLKNSDKRILKKSKILEKYSDWQRAPKKSFEKLVRLGVIIDEMIEENGFDAIAVRCWTEMQALLGISPCVVLSELNNRSIPAACEVDIANAVTMFALNKASGRPAACLDWNNNYGDDPDKCILFHCGPVPRSMMQSQGAITDHAIISNSVGKGKGYGCNTGRISPTPFTFGSMLTLNGEIEFYLGEGDFTDDPIPPDFFGCAGVARIDGLQDILQTIGYAGHRHHTSLTSGRYALPAAEAFEKYLGYNVMIFKPCE